MDILYGMWLLDRTQCGYATASHLIQKYGSAKAVYDIGSLDELSGDTRVRAAAALDIVTDKCLDPYMHRTEIIERSHMRYVSIADSSYPELLKQIHTPPPFLFYKGQNIFEATAASVAIVGSRNCSEYGRAAAMHLASDLARCGVIIVSGLARGIDAAAHYGALRGAKSSTIGVLGCGIDQIYPRENSQLYKRILDSGGMIISEFLPGTRADQNNFPQRNMVISAMTRGTLVVEAAQKSGSLITARYANEQGREVYAVPGNIDSLTCAGSNNLIKDGAKLVSDYQDILYDLFHVFSPPRENKGAAAPEPPLPEGSQKEVYFAIRSGRQTPDEIAAVTGISISDVSAALTMLELGSHIQLKSGKYRIV